jgi:hypothetical protein
LDSPNPETQKGPSIRALLREVEDTGIEPVTSTLPA